MFGLGLPELLVVLIIILIFGLPAWMSGKVARKAGFSPWWGATMLVPVLNLALVWVFAFVRWPAIDRSR